jgi:Tol biopolymer transport system component
LKIAGSSSTPVRTLVESQTYANGAAWSADGWLYYGSGASFGNRLMRVRAGGGAPETVVDADTTRNERLFYYPKALPGNRRLLVSVQPVSGDPQIVVLDVASKRRTPVAQGIAAGFVAPGYLVVLGTDGVIRGAAFSPASGAVQSEFVEIARGAEPGEGLRPLFAVSATGTMVHQRRTDLREVVRVARDGTRRPLVEGWTGQFSHPALAPDGTRLAVGYSVNGRTELWLKALPDGPFHRLVTNGSTSYRPSWSPDGKRVFFTSDHAGFIASYAIPADGSAPAERLSSADVSTDEVQMSPDGEWIVFRQGSGTQRHLYATRIGSDTAPRALLPDSRAQEYSPAVSPDGHPL